MHEAKELMDNRDVDAIIRIPSDFSKNLYTRGSSMQLILYGVDSTTATTVKGYVEGSVKQWEALNKARFINGSTAGIITVENRMWFNDANSSIWYFIPGLIVLIITIVGVFLTSLVMAREWERGTLESLFISPVKPLEILLSKIDPVFLYCHDRACFLSYCCTVFIQSTYTWFPDPYYTVFHALSARHFGNGTDHIIHYQKSVFGKPDSIGSELFACNDADRIFV